MDTTIKLLPATCKVKVERVSRKRRLLVQHGYRPYEPADSAKLDGYYSQFDLTPVLHAGQLWANESGVHTKLLSKPTIALPSGIVENAPVLPVSQAITFQADMFNETTIQYGLLAQDKIVTPAKRAAKPVQGAMFKASDTIQFGVTKSTPLMPIPDDCAIKLVLESEVIPGKASELTLQLFQDMPEKPIAGNDTGEQHDTHVFYTMNLSQDTGMAIRCAQQLLKSTNGQYRSVAYWFLDRMGLAGMRMREVK